MAIYHLTAKTGSRASGQSALAKVNYIQREGRYAREPDALVYTTSGNLPAFAEGRPAVYFEAADLYERANGRLFKEVECALPIELEPHERIELVEQLVPEILAGERLPYVLAIHQGKDHNPHVHVLVSERVNDGIARPASQWFRRWSATDPTQGGARKTDALKPKSWLETLRETWAELVNRALERAGFIERVDHRTLAAQGIARVPQIHLGPKVLRMEERGLATSRGDHGQRLLSRNHEIAERRAAVRELEAIIRAQLRGRDGATEADVQQAPPHETRGDAPRLESTLNPSTSSNVRSDVAPSLDATQRNGPAAAFDTVTPTRVLDAGTSAQAAVTDPRAEESTIAAAEPRASKRSTSPEPEQRERDRSDLIQAPRLNARPSTALDRTARAVAQQLRAMGCERFEIGVRDPRTGKLERRTWTKAEVIERLPWLKHRNARGDEIQVRPAPGASRTSLVLLRELDRRALRTLEREGLGPAAIIEAERERFEAWVRLPAPASERAREQIGRELVRVLATDARSASMGGFGQLAGFTSSRAPRREADGLRPFALLRGASGRLAPAGGVLLRETDRDLRERDESVPSR